MRAAVLHLAFDGLGATEAHSASFEDNPASQRVSLANGYEPNGSTVFDREGEAVRTLKWRLTRDAWLPRRRDDITVVGLDECRAILDR
jgi:RimJ/RimL family protein N-acetyltransferase